MKKGTNSTKRNSAFFLLLIVLTVACLLLGGRYYITNVQNSLWLHAVDDVLEVTSQGAHAFESYADGKSELLSGLAQCLSQVDSQDKDSILYYLNYFGESEGVYTAADLDGGVIYSNQAGQTELSDSRRALFEALDGSGITEPYMSQYTGRSTLDYYVRFTFADGCQGVVCKEQLVSDIADGFSLSFYDDTGFSYIVNADGDILIRSQHRNSNRTFPNVFDVIEQDGNPEDEIAAFREGVADENVCAASFTFDGVEHIFACVPLEGTDGWQLVSIIPSQAIMSHMNEVAHTSRLLLLIVAAALLIFLVFALIMRQNRRIVIEKDMELKYHQRMFRYRGQLLDILTTSTDDVYLMIAAANGSVEYVSPNAGRVLGVPHEDVEADLTALGKADYEDGARITWETLAQIPPEGSIVHECERVHRKTGERRWFQETVYRTEVDNSDYLVAVLSDRTAERQSKKALEEALEIARVANQSKSTFLSNMSHDIRTPMNAIVGLTALLQANTGDPEKVKEYSRKITASSQHLLGLINDILDMSKIESGKTELNIGEFSLPDVIEELGTVMGPLAKAKKQKFEISANGVTSEHLLGDKLRINQVLINLLSNAIKYTPEGGRVDMIVQELPQKTENFARIQFIVQDNGIGISDEYKDKIFLPFTRASNGTVSAIQGTGLGMAITKNLIDLMGGTISVESQEGRGSTFTVELDLRLQERDVDPDFWIKHGVTQLLVVDDEEDVCTSIQYAMSETGVMVRYALEGQKAVDMARQADRDGWGFDVVLLDWQMPGMNGFETARRIRKAIPAHVPILILTAYDWSEVETDSLAAGIDGFLPKPFFLSNFKQTIKNLRQRSGKAAPSEPERNAGELAGMRFLAAEDNELNAEILLELLEMEGASCDVAVNGRQALDMFEASPPGQYDAVLMDIQMPVMNGYEAARAIRASAHPNAGTIPILAMTANAFAEDVKNSLDAGMNAHIAKPVDMKRVRAAIREQKKQEETL